MTRNELDPDAHAAFVAAVAECFAEHSGPAAVRALLDDPRGDDPALRDRTVRELGLPGLAVGEELGGAGASLCLVADVLLEGGRRLVGGSLLPTALATVAVDRIGDDERGAELLAGIADGTLTATLALHDRADDPVRVASGARNGAGGPSDAPAGGAASGDAASGGPRSLRLSGTRTAVLDGLHADRLVVPVATDGGWLVALIDPAADGVEREALPPLDLTRRVADVRFRDAPATVLGGGTVADDAWQSALDAATLLLAADAVGAASAALDRAVAYAGERHQFGRPIGSFQAVKHRLAQAHVDVESARAAIEHAATRLDAADPANACDSGASATPIARGSRGASAGPATACDSGAPPTTRARSDEAATAAALAGLHALRVAPATTGTAIQVHGGIGFTWEHDAQLFHRRALAASGLLRPVAALERRLVDQACAAATTESRTASVAA